jgi:ubiquitin
MLEMVMVDVEMEMEMEKAIAKAPLSNNSTALLRRWLKKLTSLTCQMMMMMMNPRRKRKDIITVPTPPWPAKARRRSVAETERQTFQLSLCALDPCLMCLWEGGFGIQWFWPGANS